MRGARGVRTVAMTATSTRNIAASIANSSVKGRGARRVDEMPTDEPADAEPQVLQEELRRERP